MEELKFKKLKKSNKKHIIAGTLALVAITSTIMYVETRAKYQTIDSIPLARGTVTYKKTDLEVVAVLQETSNSSEAFETKGTGEDIKYYKKVASIPSSGFTLNTTYSTCDNGAVFGPSETTGLYVDKITTSGTKCTFYFDKQTLSQKLIATADKTSITTSAGFGVVDTSSGGLYEFEGITEGSKTQFYRGVVTNNYVRLGKDASNYTFWRIVRFDEDGNIRLIYDGTRAHDNGEASDDRQLTTNYDGTNVYKPKYHSTSAETNVKWSRSAIKTYLEGTWLTAFESKLSVKEKGQLTTGKFCSDISIETISGSTKYYGARGRLETKKEPSFRCDSGEITTSKVGMLSADEYSFAGGGGYYTEDGNNTNTTFYLYTGQAWWTLSPYYWNGSYAHVFIVGGEWMAQTPVTNATRSVRPILTLKGDTMINLNAKGTKDNPYVIV